MNKSIIIIGAGMAGLSAGCYGQMNGYHTQIFEMHNIPGGLCTAWKRKGYTFDISLHLFSASRTGGMHTMWEELGAIQGRRLVDHDIQSRIEVQGKRLVVYRDLDRFEQHLLELAPDDAQLIQEFTGLARKCGGVEVWIDKPPELFGVPDFLRMFFRMLPMLGIFRKYGKMSLQDFAARFRDPFLREAIRLMLDTPGWPMPDMPLIGVVMVLGWQHTGNASYPVGGSMPVAQAVAKRYTDLGGKIQYKSRVEKILVENDRVVGVRLSDGSEHRADVVISAADGHTAIFEMLAGRYVSDEIRRNYQEWRVYPPIIQVMLGVARDLSDEPHSIIYQLNQPITIAGEERDKLQVLHYCFDPTMAPEGKSVVQVWYTTNFDYWKGLYEQKDRYKAEKQQIADLTIAELDKRWPGFAGQVEVVDVPTPMTYWRYTGNRQGSPDGWCITTRNATKRMPKTLPGLSGFYMAGQWTVPFSGVPGAAMTGRQVIQMLCKQDKKRFVTTMP